MTGAKRSVILTILTAMSLFNSGGRRVLLLLMVLIFSHPLAWGAAETPSIDLSKVSVSFPPLPINTTKPDTALDQFIFYLPDTDGQLDAQAAFSHASAFIPLKNRPVTFHTKTHWYAIHLSNAENISTELFITTGVSTAVLLRGYWLRTQETQHSNSEIQTISSQIAYGFPTLLMRLPLKENEDGVLLIEYQSIAHFPLTLHIFDSTHLLESTQRLKLANGIYIGAIGILFLFFFGQFLISREKVYFYYSMFVFFAILMMVQVGGPAHLFNQNATNQATLTTIAGGGIYTFYFIFAAEFFQLRVRNRLLYKVLASLSVCVLALTIIGVIYPTAYALSIVIAIGLPWPVVGAIWAWKQKISSAAFFLVGSLAHCVSTYFLLLTCLGVALFRNELIFRIACLGLMFDIVCFAVAIIYHSNQVRLNYNRQLQERINDLDALAASEQISAKALSMSKQAVLNLAATAHDLQQPLSAMQLLLSLQNSTDPISKNVQTALNYACTLLNSAIGSAQQNYQILSETIDAFELLDATRNRHRNTFTSKKLQLHLHCKPAPIICLPIVVNRILDNLLSNAYKYTQQGRILISGRLRSNGIFLIQVWDTGRGMDHKQVNKLTTPFERLNESTELGFGLGLFIVKSLCHQAGYEFSIRSHENRGSCFSIWVPQTKAKEAWVVN